MNYKVSLSNSLIKILKSDYLAVLCVGIIFLLPLASMSSFKIFSSRIVVSIFYSFPELGFIALATLLVMITGGIDLSLVGIANLSATIAGLALKKMQSQGYSEFIMIVIAFILFFVVSALCGLLNGSIISFFNLHPFLVTLGTMSLFTGIAVVITGGKAIVSFPETLVLLGNFKIGIFPMPALLFFVVMILLGILLTYTAYGKKLYMFGDNEVATKFSGINKKKLIIKTYMIAAILAGIAGLILMGKTNSAKADYGLSYTLQGILVCLLGGVSWDGGKGRVLGITISLFMLQFISSSLNLLKASPFLKDFFWGFLLLFVVVVEVLLIRYMPPVINKLEHFTKKKEPSN